MTNPLTRFLAWLNGLAGKFLAWLQMFRDMSASVAAIEAQQTRDRNGGDTVADELREIRLRIVRLDDSAETAKSRGENSTRNLLAQMSADSLEMTQLIGVLETHHEAGNEKLLAIMTEFVKLSEARSDWQKELHERTWIEVRGLAKTDPEPAVDEEKIRKLIDSRQRKDETHREIAKKRAEPKEEAMPGHTPREKAKKKKKPPKKKPVKKVKK